MKKKYGVLIFNLIKTGVILCVGLGIILSGLVLLWISTFKIPTLNSFEDRKVVESTKIYDHTGEIVLYDVFQDIKRTVIPYNEISPNIKRATLAIEDVNFYNHGGVDPKAILRAIWVNFTSGGFNQGGSTITQQVIKNSVLSNEKTITRKLKEWVLAIRLENILSKDEILNLYLNEIPYGGSLYGVAEASYAFFGKSASDLTIAESAYLASLPQAPTYYSPYGNHLDDLDNRKNLVLKKMYENNFISEAEYEQAKNEVVEFKKLEDQGIKAPHFVLWVREMLAEKYGEETLESGGLKVVTTLDWDLQQKAEEIVKKYALENEKKYNASNAALVAIDPKTGGILTMVGSRDYFDEEIDGNFNAAVSENRQPGSTFKPFAYAQAFNRGYTPETVIFDAQTEFSMLCRVDDFVGNGDCYAPVNYDNIYRGPVSMREALAQSINIPAIKTLYLAGRQETLDLAKKMGVKTLTNVDQYGLTLVLGGGEVSLIDMTSAYGVFANNGIRVPYNPILKVTDKSGNVLEEFTQPEEERVLDENIALKISDILNDNIARTPTFGANSFLYFPRHDVAVKTGTTNNYRDAWIIGYTPKIAVGSWAGNNDNTPMEKRVAGFIIAPLWNEFMQQVLNEYADQNFTKPFPEPNQEELKPVLQGQWQVGGRVHSILHWVETTNPRGPVPSNPSQDPQYPYWEYGVQNWLSLNKIVPINNKPAPTSNTQVNFQITSPSENQVLNKNEITQIKTSLRGDTPVVSEFYINSDFIGGYSGLPSFVELDLSKYAVGSKAVIQTVVRTRDNKTYNDKVNINISD